jgi:hypothetical protein
MGSLLFLSAAIVITYFANKVLANPMPTRAARWFVSGFIGLFVPLVFVGFASKTAQTLEERVAEKSKISLQKLIQCDREGGSFYVNECKTKTGVYYAIVGDHSSDGVSLQLRNNCADSTLKKRVDAENLNYEYSRTHRDKCVRVIAQIGLENFATPDVKVEETIWIESDASFAVREEDRLLKKDQERIAREQRAQAKAEQKALALEKNKRNARWLADEYTLRATGPCKKAVEKLAKYDYEWTDGFTEMKFGQYVTQVPEDYVVTIAGDKIKLQNVFGAWQHKEYYCDYDVKNQKVLRARVK